MRVRSVAVTSVGGGAVSRGGARDVLTSAGEAALEAITQSGLDRTRIDGYVGCHEPPGSSFVRPAEGADKVTWRTVVRALGLDSVRVAMDLPQQELGIGLLRQAWRLIVTGECEMVLVVRATGHRPRAMPQSLDARAAAGREQFTLPIGVGVPVPHALRWRRYLHTYGRDEDELFAVISNAWRRAQVNPLAIWTGRAIPTKEDYEQSPRLFAPLRLLDCDMPVDGGVAFVVCAADRARDSVDSPCYINGFFGRTSPSHSFGKVSGLNFADVSNWQLYDGFAYMVIESLEWLGLADRGTGLDVLEQWNIGTGQDEIALNTAGGSLGEGRLHGMGHLREAVLQVRGEASDRQVSAPGFTVVDMGTDIAGGTVVMGPEEAWLGG